MPLQPFEFVFENEAQKLKHEAEKTAVKLRLTKQKALKKDILISILLDLHDTEDDDVENSALWFKRKPRSYLLELIRGWIHIVRPDNLLRNEALEAIYKDCFVN